MVQCFNLNLQYSIEMVFETQNLVVRQLKLSDLDGMFDLHRNENVMRYTSTLGKVQTIGESREELERIISGYKHPGSTFRVWGTERKSDSDFIGTCALIGEDNDLGYRIRQQHWRRGYASEIAHGLIRYAFDVLGLEHLTGVSDARNIASVRVLDKNMQFVREFYNEEMQCTDRVYKLHRNGLSVSEHSILSYY